MFKRVIGLGEEITFVGPEGAWIRLVLEALAESRVLLGCDWEEGYRPRGGSRYKRLGRFRVMALEFVGDRVEIGIDVPAGFHAIPRGRAPGEEGVSKTRGRGTEKRRGEANGGARRRRAGRRGRGKQQRKESGQSAPAGAANGHQQVSPRLLKKLLSLNEQRL